MHIATIMANQAETNMENETKIKMKLLCSVSVLGMLRNTRVIHENRFGRLWNIPDDNLGFSHPGLRAP